MANKGKSRKCSVLVSHRLNDQENVQSCLQWPPTAPIYQTQFN